MRSHLVRYICILFCLFFLTGSNSAFTQNPASYYYENEFDLSIPIKGKWSMETGVGNRGLFAEVTQTETSGYQHQHFEINHFTNYNSSEFFVMSLGLRYRFKEIFDSSNVDEIRIIEQIEIGSSNPVLPVAHRFRLEQRFRENTVHRVRYEIEVNKPLTEVFSWFASTEGLLALSSGLKPEAEQRFSLGIEIASFKDLGLELGIQYRMEDYARNFAQEFFIITGVSLDL